MTKQTLQSAFVKLKALRDEYEGLGLSWGSLKADQAKADVERCLYISHYKIWQHAHYIRSLMNEMPIDEPILNGRFQVFFPCLKAGHYSVAKRVLEGYLCNRVTQNKHPVGFEFSYDHPRFSVDILAERSNLRSVHDARNLALELVSYSSVARCALEFKNQAFRSAQPSRPWSMGMGGFGMSETASA